MISPQKILTHITIIALVFTNTGSFVFAQGEVLHSLNELPSIQEEEVKMMTSDIHDTEAPASLSELVQEKMLYESTHVSTSDDTQEEQDISIIGSALVHEHEVFIAQTKLALTPGIAPTLTPNFITNPFTFTNTGGSLFDTFILGYESSGTDSITIEKDGRKYTKKERKVAGTKGTITAKIREGTIIKTTMGEVVTESMLDIVSLEKEKKTKAQKKYEKAMKNRGTIKKGRAEAQPEGFDFGIVGKHLIFSQPIAITIATPNMSDGVTFDLLTMHAGDTDFHTGGLSVDSTTLCSADGTASIPGSQTVVKDGKVTFYTCGASSFTMNPSGGTGLSNDVKLIIGDCGQIQVYYKGAANIFSAAPAATGCGGNSSWPILRIGTTKIGSGIGNAWTSATTTGSQIGNTYTATTTMTALVGGLTYGVTMNWSYTAPNAFFRMDYTVNIPTGNTQNVKFYYGMDSFVAGADANDVGYYTGGTNPVAGIYDSVARQLLAIKYISGQPWAGYESGPYSNISTRINGGTNFNNTTQATAGDLGFGVNWDFGTTPGTYSSSSEWRMLPYVNTNVADLVPSVGQPSTSFTVNQVSLIPVVITNVGNIPSSGIMTGTFTVPTNFTGPTSAFVDNGWNCGATVGTTVTCTKSGAIAALGTDTFSIPVKPSISAAGSMASFSITLANSSDSNTTNNSATISLQTAVVGQTQTLWLKADAGTSCTLSGCSLTSWSDQSGLSNNFTLTGGSPKFASLTSNFNPTIQFDGNSALSRLGSLNLRTLYIVYRHTSTRIWENPFTNDNGGNGVFHGSDSNKLYHSIYTPSTTLSGTHFVNGLLTPSLDMIRPTAYTLQTRILTANDTSASTYTIGQDRANIPRGITGNIAEIIAYSIVPTSTERQKIESYLAIKYGITLDQTTARDYIFSDGSVMWSASAGGVYKNDIAGIGRDVATTLDQKKSQSINNPTDIIIEKSTSLTDKTGLVWANNGFSTGATTTTPGGLSRITRAWKIEENNGDVGTVKISYPNSVISGVFSTPVLIVSTDGTFSAGTTTTIAGTLVSGNWEYSVNITDGSVISFGQAGDIVAPMITSTNIASGTLIPHGNFSLTYNYTDTGAGINPITATGRIYSWNTGTLTYNVVPLSGYMNLGSSNTTSAAMNISNLPHGRYRFDLSISDTSGNITTQSYTYFVDAIEWTISADTYNIGNIVQNIASFGTGELLVTVKTVGAGFSLTTNPVSILARPSGETLNYWNGAFGVGFDIWNGGAFGGTILTYSPNATLASVVKNINQNGEKNTFTYRVKYGARVDFMQAAGDYNGSVSFGLNLNY